MGQDVLGGEVEFEVVGKGVGTIGLNDGGSGQGDGSSLGVLGVTA